MKIQAYIDEIKLDITGGILELEIDDTVLKQIVNSAMRELQRYICSTKLITVPYEKCIDLTPYKVNAVARVYRANTEASNAANSTDPLQLGFYQLATGGNMYNYNDFINRYASWNLIQQTANTTSTDLAFYYEDSEKKLYVNTTMNKGANITIEYIPRYDKVEDITSDYWIDILMRLSKALTKTTVGRIRSRFTQSNALWTQDGAELLQQGQAELAEIRQHLQSNTQLIYPLD